MKLSIEYLAGLFDGEGCVFVQRMDRVGRGVRIPQHMVWARLNMCHRPLIEMLAEQLDASIIVHKKDLKNPRHRRAYEVSLYGNKAADFLRSVYEFLVIKKEEARLAIELQDHLNRYKGKLPNMPIEHIEPLIAYREIIRLQVKAIKTASFIGVSDWNAGEFGEHPMPDLFEDAEGQYRAKQELTTPGVCNEHVPAPKGKICSALHGNMQNAAEMTASHVLRRVK